MNKDVKKRASHRSKIINGQINALVKAIDSDEYCVDIITQSLAIQQSLRSLNQLVLEGHMQTHVKDGFKSGSDEQVETLITEMMKLYKLSGAGQ